MSDKSLVPKIGAPFQGALGVKSSTFAPVDEARKAEKAAEDFEALLLKQMLGAMWQTVPGGGMYGSGTEGVFYRDMFNDGIAKEMAKGQGLGVKDILLRDMQRLQGQKE